MHSGGQSTRDVIATGLCQEACTLFRLAKTTPNAYTKQRPGETAVGRAWGNDRHVLEANYCNVRPRPLGRPRRRWVDNIKVDLREDGMVWIGLIWLRIGTSGGLLRKR
jgi:hypothetical protein